MIRSNQNFRPPTAWRPIYSGLVISVHVVSNANVHADLDKLNLSKQIPLGRVGRAEEVADAAAFLATNSYANNCILTIDGGLNAAFKSS